MTIDHPRASPVVRSDDGAPRLTGEQLLVVRHESGPLLVVAGPGSGKTRVIAERVVGRIAAGAVDPARVLAITFTQAAAAEMRARIQPRVERAERLHVGTFHWMCSALLRRYIHVLGYRRDFSVLSPARARDVMSRAWRTTWGTPHDVGRMQVAVSSVKNGLDIGAAAARHGVAATHLSGAIDVYDSYKRRRNLVDLDDLLSLTVKILQADPHVRHLCRRAHDEIVVDEFQDINPVQYELLELLAPATRTVVAVGDDDQAIYAWRQALPESLAAFEQRFPGCRVVALQHNFRSTKYIVRAANALIAGNRFRIPTRMTTDNPAGERTICLHAVDDVEEGDAIAACLYRLNSRQRIHWSDMAVIFRVNAQARTLEEACVRHGIPYRVHARHRFFERPEVRHAIAYARLALDRRDSNALAHLLAALPGVGPARLARLRELAAARACDLIDLVSQQDVAAEALPARARPGMARLADVLALIWESRNRSVPAVIDVAVQATREHFSATGNAVTDPGDDFLAELASLAQDVHRRRGTLRSLLERFDAVPESDASKGGVWLLSLHAAKGLEFDTVFLSGLEEGLLPHYRSLSDDQGVEEERRLCYVGMTRARSRLFLSWAGHRTIAGTRTRRVKSRFLTELRGAGLRYEKHSSVRAARASEQAQPPSVRSGAVHDHPSVDTSTGGGP